MRGEPVLVERNGHTVSLSVTDTGEGRTEFERPKGKPLRRGVHEIGNDVGDTRSRMSRSAPAASRRRDGVLFYGEVRINQPAAGTFPTYVRWAALDKGARRGAVPITFNVPVAKAQASGPFVVVESGPSQVWVALRPKGTGTQRGRTGMRIGKQRVAPPGGGIVVDHQTDQIRFGATNNDRRWFIELEGRGLRQGTTRTEGLKIARNGLQCTPASSRFTITQLRLKRGHISNFEVRFTQRCRSGPTLTGTASWRAR